MCLWEMIFPDKNQICKILLSGFRIACCRMNISIYSVTMKKILIQLFSFFAPQIEHGIIAFVGAAHTRPLE